jgi:hypothetical protein
MQHPIRIEYAGAQSCLPSGAIVISHDVFHRIARTFAEGDYEINRDSVVFVARDELFSIRLRTSEGALHVIENDVAAPVARWLANRLARLPLLAERIIQYSEKEEHFITPSADANLCSEHPDFADNEIECKDAVSALHSLLNWEPAGTSSVTYVTSDGGEGKTTLTNHLAVEQARAYRTAAAHWLLLPIELGGRPFLRLDEITVGTLVNKYRFSYLYYDSLIELIKLGLIVPAIDGFEEMFIEDPSGDATSSLGRLLDSLDSNGRVLISARKAFFEFRNLGDQTRLYDSIRGKNVAFSRLKLRRWSREQFITYAERCRVQGADELYTSIADALGDPGHPLITRPVLIKQLVESSHEPELRGRFVSLLEGARDEYLDTLIQTVIGREISRKWIDRTGDVAKPLLEVEEHLRLLSDVALEMWRTGTQSIRIDTLMLVVELFLESAKKTTTVQHQVMKWAPQHALLVKRDERFLQFDHEEIYSYFLARALAVELVRASSESIQNTLRTAALSRTVASMLAVFAKNDRARTLKVLQDVARGEGPSSIAMENSATILSMLLVDSRHESAITVEQVIFPPRLFNLRSLSNVTFLRCAFGAIEAGAWRNVHFVDSSVDELGFGNVSRFDNCSIDHSTSVRSIHQSPPREITLFSPDKVRSYLAARKLLVTPSAVVAVEPDEFYVLAEKVIGLFLRATELNEQSIRKRLGTRGPGFFDDVLPAMLNTGAIAVIRYQGQGSQERYRLGRPLSEISNALSKAQGNFSTFLGYVSGSLKP